MYPQPARQGAPILTTPGAQTLSIPRPATTSVFLARTHTLYDWLGHAHRRSVPLVADPVFDAVFEAATIDDGIRECLEREYRAIYVDGYDIARSLLGTGDAQDWAWSARTGVPAGLWADIFHRHLAPVALAALEDAEDAFWGAVADALEHYLFDQGAKSPQPATDWMLLGTAFGLVEHDLVQALSPSLLSV